MKQASSSNSQTNNSTSDTSSSVSGTGITNRTPSKSSNRRQNISKSKAKKSSSQYSTSISSSQQNPSSSSTTTGTAASDTQSGSTSSGKEKVLSHHKFYAGLNVKSVKCIWEQYDKSDTDVNPDVYARLAEDCTYKLWELANNLKTYTRHSGGKLTVDLVNEVLKDSDVPPSIGAGSTYWDKIEYDGTYFFHFDEVLELRDEYLKEIQTTQCGPLELTTNWWANKEAGDDLNHLCSDLCYAIFTGNEITFNYAIHTALINPFVGCITRPILVKCIEMLATVYTEDTLDRCLKFLLAIVHNYHTRDSAINDKLFHLSQLMTCLLLGPLDLNVSMAQHKQRQLQQLMKNERVPESMKHEQQDVQFITLGDGSMHSDVMAMVIDEKPLPSTINEQHKQMEEEINCISKELQNIKQEPLPTYASMNVEDIRNGYEDLFQMMEDEGFSGKLDQHDEDDFKGFKIKQEYFEKSSTGQQQNQQEFDLKLEVKTEPFDQQPCASSSMSQSSFYTAKTNGNETIFIDPFPHDDFDAHDFSPIKTLMCDEKYIDDVCRLIGCAADKWGYFEKEVIFLLSKRLELFFISVTEYTDVEYDWLCRTVRGLVSLGNFAVRELTHFLNRIDPDFVPNWLECHFNQIAMFLRGKSDIFFYEYLNELCGDGLTPFLIYYSNYLEKFTNKRNKRKTPYTDDFKIMPKLILKWQFRNKQLQRSHHAIDEMFPQCRPLRERKIAFRFAGASPVILKPKQYCFNTPIVQDSDALCAFNRRIVLGKRKLLTPITRIRGKQTDYNLKGLIL